jgi:hypothetical protein
MLVFGPRLDARRVVAGARMWVVSIVAEATFC